MTLSSKCNHLTRELFGSYVDKCLHILFHLYCDKLHNIMPACAVASRKGYSAPVILFRILDKVSAGQRLQAFLKDCPGTKRWTRPIITIWNAGRIWPYTSSRAKIHEIYKSTLPSVFLSDTTPPPSVQSRGNIKKNKTKGSFVSIKESWND